MDPHGPAIVELKCKSEMLDTIDCLYSYWLPESQGTPKTTGKIEAKK